MQYEYYILSILLSIKYCNKKGGLGEEKKLAKFHVKRNKNMPLKQAQVVYCVNASVVCNNEDTLKPFCGTFLQLLKTSSVSSNHFWFAFFVLT